MRKPLRFYFIAKIKVYLHYIILKKRMLVMMDIEKIAREAVSGRVKIPEGGLRPGLLTNDLTQLMTRTETSRHKLYAIRRSSML